MNKAVVRACASAILALAVASCGSEPEAPVEAAPEAPPGVTVTDGRMNLPAVEGNPGAVYFTLANDGEQDVMVHSVNVDGAGSAVMHQMATWNNQPDMQEVLQLGVPAGDELAFEPGGYHVMAMDADPSLEVGGETEVTVTFVGGDKISFPVEILAPGDEG